MNFYKYIQPFVLDTDFDTFKDWKARVDEATESYKDYEESGLMEEIDSHMGYAVKEGYLDGRDARLMTYDERDDYYNECVAFDPDDYEYRLAEPDAPRNTLDDYQDYKNREMANLKR